MSGRPNTGGPKLRRLNMGQVFIILAVVSAILTVVLFRNLTANKNVPAKLAESNVKTLVVATHDILKGEPITADAVKTMDWPEAQYPEGEVFEGTEKIVGRVAKDAIYMGQPIYRQMLAGEDSKGGMPVVIPQGYRAMTILVSENKGVGGFVKPGDHVDILGTFEFALPEATQKALAAQSPLLESSVRTSQTVLQDIMVLAIAQDMYEKKAVDTTATDSKPAPAAPGTTPAPATPEEATKGKVVSSVTLAVTPEQAEKLAYADGKGDLRLTLRPENEREEVHLLGTVQQDVISLAKLYEKFSALTAALPPELMGNGLPPMPPLPETGSTGLPPSANMPPPSFSGLKGSSKSVEIIQGSEKSNVSF